MGAVGGHFSRLAQNTMNKLVSTSLVVAGLLATLPAQNLSEGYRSTVRGLPVGAGSVGVVGGGSLVYFDGTQLLLDDGGSTRVLLSFPGSVFGSFSVQVTPTELLFAESSTGGVWLVPFAGAGAPTKLATINFAYSAAAFDQEWAIVSAKTGGFGAADNDVVAVHLRTGQVDDIALLPGASGPVVVDGDQNLYYATASNSYPPPVGGVDVLRFSKSAIESAFGAAVLTVADATIAYSGLDAAGSMTMDADDDLFVVDWVNSQIVELSDVNGGVGGTSVLADYSGVSFAAGSVQFVTAPTGPRAAQFEPFQPQGAGDLVVHESSYGSLSQVRYALPARPRTTVTPDPIPAGRFSVVTTGGPSHGRGVLALGARSDAERPVVLGGFEQTLFWGLAARSSLVVLPADFDASGQASVDLVNPGFGVTLTVGAQALFVGATAAVLGSAPPVTLTLQ